jgi:thymidylate kinase
MKKSILFSGRQGTGKTTKIKTLLSCLNHARVTEMTFEKFQLSIKSELASQFDFIAIDEIFNPVAIEYLSMATFSHGFFFIVGAQLSVKELEDIDLSIFHIVELDSFQTGG